jgi:hypothetical protein
MSNYKTAPGSISHAERRWVNTGKIWRTLARNPEGCPFERQEFNQFIFYDFEY